VHTRATPSSTPSSAAQRPLAADEAAARLGRPAGGWRLALYRVIFESDTPAGRRFDLLLIWLILVSVAVVMLDSFERLHERWGAT
jgi:voltage-gated potassium channel